MRNYQNKSERRKTLLDICKDESKNEVVSMYLNLMVFQDSLPILKKKGVQFSVISKLPQHNNLGSCYLNSVMKMREGYKYVEGVAYHKESR